MQDGKGKGMAHVPGDDTFRFAAKTPFLSMPPTSIPEHQTKRSELESSRIAENGGTGD